MDHVMLAQGTEEWRLARVGSLGSSRMADAIARTRTGWGASRGNLMAELLIERLTGRPTETYQSPAMRWGTETEPEARAEYEFQRDVEIQQVGLVRHPTIRNAHASPDGLVGADGLVEIKCPLTATHLETLLSGDLPAKYWTQVWWQMACTGRQWCDYVSFDPRVPQRMRLYVKRIHRNNDTIAQLEVDARNFLRELDEKLADLERVYGRAA